MEFLPLEFLPLEFLPLEFLPLEFLPLEFLPLEFLPLMSASLERILKCMASLGIEVFGDAHFQECPLWRNSLGSETISKRFLRDTIAWKRCSRR